MPIPYPGYGGHYFEDGQLKVYLKSASAAVQATRILHARADVRAEYGAAPRVIVRQGQFDFAELEFWHRHLGALPSYNKLTLTDVDERRNRVRLGVEDLSLIPQIYRELDAIGVPRQAVIFEHVSKLVFPGIAPAEKQNGPRVREGEVSALGLSYDSLHHHTMTLRGGFKIETRFNSPRPGGWTGALCSIGMNGQHRTSGLMVYLSAAHCSRQIGWIDYADTFQPDLNSGLISDEELRDPQSFWSGQKPTGEICPSGQCKDSDVAIYSYSTSRYTPLEIARMENLSGKEIDRYNPAIPQGGLDAVRLISGGQVYKLGSASGNTNGQIIDHCVNVPFTEPATGIQYTFWCFHTTNHPNEDEDSGGPIYRIYDGEAHVYGFTSGRVQISGQTRTLMSPAINLYSEDGFFVVPQEFYFCKSLQC